MKQFMIIILIAGFSMGASANSGSYEKVIKAKCANNEERLNLDLSKQILEARIKDGGKSLNLSLAPLRQEDPSLRVEILRDFYESGHDVMGGVVADGANFGTVVILLDKELNASKSQEMTVVYIEAMTGRQWSTTMLCQFE